MSEDRRCSWCLGDSLYERYHDNEWGKPCKDPIVLFESLNLEGAQAGLSWITILKKREAYRRLFAGFDPEKIARFNDAKLEEIASNPGIVRHAQKVKAVRSNARAYLAIVEKGQTFDEFVWRYVDGVTQVGGYSQLTEVPAKTDISTKMSKDLKKLGFSFVGPTTCYAFMQAVGLVNDHIITCPEFDATV